MTVVDKYEILYDQYSEREALVLRITQGEWIGLEFSFGSIKITEFDDEGAICHFSYNVVKGDKPTDPQKLTELEDLFGQILHDVMEKSFEQTVKPDLEPSNENGTSNPSVAGN